MSVHVMALTSSAKCAARKTKAFSTTLSLTGFKQVSDCLQWQFPSPRCGLCHSKPLRCWDTRQRLKQLARGSMVGSWCTKQICNFDEAQPRHFSTVAKPSDKSPPSLRRTGDVCRSRQLLMPAAKNANSGMISKN